MRRARSLFFALHVLATSTLAVAAVATAPADAHKGNGRGQKARLEVPAAPLLAGDLLTLSRRAAFGQGQLDRLQVSMGEKSAEWYAIDRHTLRLVVPPGVAGEQTVRVIEQKRRRQRVLFQKAVEFAPTDIRTPGPGPEGQQFGLFFSAATTLDVGSIVEGWVLADDVSLVGTTSPISVSGTVLSQTGTVTTLLLSGTAFPEKTDTSGSKDPRVVTLGDTTLEVRVDLATGDATGSIATPDAFLPIEDLVIVGGKIVVPDAPPAPRVEKLLPPRAPAGSVVKVIGSGFGKRQGRNRVVLGGRPVSVFPRVTAWEDDVVEFELPNFAAGPYELILVNDLIPSIPMRLLVEPRCPHATDLRRELEVGAGSAANAVIPTQDCGYLVAGRTTDAAGDTDALIVRFDAQGSVIWTRTFGGSGFDEANDVKELHEGFLFIGTTASKEFDAQAEDVLVMRISEEGVPVWRKVIGGRGDEQGRGLTIDHGHEKAPTRLAVVGATSADVEEKGTDGLVVLMSTDGDVLDQRSFGGVGDDRLDDVTASGRGGLVAVGRTRSQELGAAGEFRPWVLSLDDAANVISSTSHAVGRGDAFASSVEPTGTGSFGVTGQSGTGIDVDTPYGDRGAIFLLEVDAAGNVDSFVNHDGRGQDVGVAGAFPDGDGGFVLAAFTDSSEFGANDSDPLLIDTNCRGGIVDVKRPGATPAVERIFGAARLPGDAYAVAGEVQTSAGRHVLLATESAFDDDAPSIEVFTGNEDTAARVRQGDPLVLRWRVRDADTIRVQRLATNGPPLDLELAGGALVDQIFTFPSFSLNGNERCESDGTCGDAVYRLIARTACAVVVANVTVTVMPVDSDLSADQERLLEIESMIVQRFDQPEAGILGDPALAKIVQECDADGNCSSVTRLLPGSHLDATVFPPQNICIAQSGFPYANLGAASSALAGVVDDAEPALLSYATDRSIASWSYGRLLFERGQTTPPQGLPVPDSSWFGHYSGWHTGDGGMTVWGVDQSIVVPGVGSVPIFPLVPDPVCPEPPEFGNGTRAAFCGATPDPLVFHPNAWDVHFFRDLDGGGLIRVGRFSGELGLSDPCTGAPIVGNDCETGDDPLTVPGTNDVISVFPRIDFENGTFIPTACGQ